MVKKHIKRHATPRTWNILRKETAFIKRPNPGAHPLSSGMSINEILKMLGYARTARDARRVLHLKEVIVDGKRVKDPKHIVGFMDIISLPEIKKAHRIILGEDGRISAVEVDSKEAMVKPCKIKNKTMTKGGKVQLNLFDGKNILVEKKEFRVGDTVLVEFPKNTVKEHFKLEKGAFIVLTAGKHTADTGVIDDIQGNKVIYKSAKNKTLTTMKEYAFAVGKEKAAVSVSPKK